MKCNLPSFSKSIYDGYSNFTVCRFPSSFVQFGLSQTSPKDILDKLCNEVLVQQPSVLLYFEDDSRPQPLLVQYLLQVVDFIGLPVMVAVGESASLIEVSSEVWLVDGMPVCWRVGFDIQSTAHVISSHMKIIFFEFVAMTNASASRRRSRGTWCRYVDRLRSVLKIPLWNSTYRCRQHCRAAVLLYHVMLIEACRRSYRLFNLQSNLFDTVYRGVTPSLTYKTISSNITRIYYRTGCAVATNDCFFVCDVTHCEERPQIIRDSTSYVLAFTFPLFFGRGGISLRLRAKYFRHDVALTPIIVGYMSLSVDVPPVCRMTVKLMWSRRRSMHLIINR